MIFVVTGVHYRGFDRLVRAVDDLAGRKIIGDVFIQIGFSSYEPQHCTWERTIEYSRFEQYIDEAEVVVSHGGAGCIAGALERNKPIIAVPRLKRYDEASNDNQLKLISVLEEEGRILAVYELDDLAGAIQRAQESRSVQVAEENQVSMIVREFLLRTAEDKDRYVLG